MIISVQSGFIAVYFAILKLIGINTASGTGFLPLVQGLTPSVFWTWHSFLYLRCSTNS